MKWSWCGCDVRLLVRLTRRPWMRILRSRRHYFCAKCKERQFLSRRTLLEALPVRDDLHGKHTAHVPLPKDVL